ncbi:hypothetical protein GCM10020258_10670 [Sphingomonas yabuuchiae]
MLAGIQPDLADIRLGGPVQSYANQRGADALSVPRAVDHAPAEMRDTSVRADGHPAAADEATIPFRHLKRPLRRIMVEKMREVGAFDGAK